jgi:hypothetical protein
MATAEAPPAQATKKATEYVAFRHVSGKVADIIKAIEAEVGDGVGLVLIKIGTATTDQQPGPKKAMEAVAEHKDLDGDYAVSSASSVKLFPGLKTKVKRGIEGL